MLAGSLIGFTAVINAVIRSFQQVAATIHGSLALAKLMTGVDGNEA